MPATPTCIPPAPHDLEEAIEQEARTLVAHAERAEHISTDPGLSAVAGARLLLKLNRVNGVLLAACREAEKDAEEAGAAFHPREER
jgi:hypothetical protein